MRARRKSLEAVFQGEEGPASVPQPFLVLAGKQGHWSTTPFVDLGADQDERAFGPAFDLQPAVSAAAPVATIAALGDNALKSHRLGAGKEGGAATDNMVAELDSGLGAGPTVERLVKDDAQQIPALLERSITQVLAVEERCIEGKEDQPMRRVRHRVADRLEVGVAVLVLNDHLTVDHRRSAA